MKLDLTAIEAQIDAARQLDGERRAARAVEVMILIGPRSSHTIYDTEVSRLKRARERCYTELLGVPVAAASRLIEREAMLATEPEPEPRFWTTDIDPGEPASPLNWLDEGKLVGIVDEQEGGIIVYCHVDNTDRILNALRSAG